MLYMMFHSKRRLYTYIFEWRYIEGIKDFV